MKIIMLQPYIPHYREYFFNKLKEIKNIDIFCYDLSKIDAGFLQANTSVIKISTFQFGALMLFNPFSILKKEYSTLILMLHFGHMSTWLILLTKWIHRKNIILWGQGISVKRYMIEEIKPDWKLKYMLYFADGAWLYTEKEANQWQKIFPHKKIVALNNTLELKSQVKLDQPSIHDYKKKYNIIQNRILLFSARFENKYRRTDLLINVIERLDPNEYGFIIIGSGSLKPDFSIYKNVYDFGKLYGEKIKNELFSIADIYYLPGWVGLSIVEAMSYSLPIFTFRRSEEIKQCVEYSYIENTKNGFLFESVEESITIITTITDEEIKKMGKLALQFFKHNLIVDRMINNALSIL